MTSCDVGSLLARVGAGLFQQAYIVTDRAVAERSMRMSFGCTRFASFEMEGDWVYRGRPVSCTLSLAFGRSGDVQIELMQPLHGEGIHFEFLERRGPGLHHLGFMIDDMAASVAAAERDGFTAAMSGGFGGVGITYLDTVDALGLYVELIDDPNGMLARTMPWRDDKQQPHR